ncbi:hypothetical protein ABN028_19475 [Actinopolymorpha sp. B17G11]|uniref:hypothetical protein n=1 Tax=Actinopolymorpha sp. B17G11 TaxID=3160861 RepID=UPI0032E42D09
MSHITRSELAAATTLVLFRTHPDWPLRMPGRIFPHFETTPGYPEGGEWMVTITPLGDAIQVRAQGACLEPGLYDPVPAFPDISPLFPDHAAEIRYPDDPRDMVTPAFYDELHDVVRLAVLAVREAKPRVRHLAAV